MTLLLSAAACAAGVANVPTVPSGLPTAVSKDETPPARDPIGVAAREFDDVVRGRHLTVLVWYPAAAGTVERPIQWDGIFPGSGARDAPLQGNARRLPLLLLSHGSGSDGSQLAWIAEGFAARGWLVAAVDHPGDRFGDQAPEGIFAIWRRARDVSVTLTSLLADPEFGPRIDSRRVAAAGHSSGGFTVLALAGARFNPRAMRAFCAGAKASAECTSINGLDLSTMPDLSEAGRSYRDPRVRAVVAMAPAMGPGTTSASLKRVRIPVQVVAGLDDELVPLRQNGGRVARQIPGAQLVTLPDAGHFVFMPVCSETGRLLASQVCVDPAPELDRAAAHAFVVNHASGFLERALQIRAGARLGVARPDLASGRGQSDVQSAGR